MKKRYSVTEDQCNCKLAEFFDNIAKLSGETGDISNLKYDCRKICVTKPVHEYIWKYYSDAGNSTENVAALLLLYGPKANLDGDALEVEIEDGFIVRG